MALPVQVTWVLMKFTRDLTIMNQSLPILYLLVLKIYNYCFIEFNYEIYLRKDYYTWKNYIISSILFFFLGLLGPALTIVTWIFLPYIKLEIYREAAPEFSQTWMGILYMILATILAVVFQPIFETTLYYVVADICFEMRWFWRILSSLFWSFVPVWQLYYQIEPTDNIVHYENKNRWIWLGIVLGLAFILHLISYCVRERNVLNQLTLKVGFWLGIYQAKMAIYWGWFAWKTVEITKQFSKENVFDKF